ncbi:MAG: hypothetical protein ACRC2B_24375 [Rubrivivax sp.]
MAMPAEFASLEMVFAIGVLLMRLLQIGAGVLLCVLGYRLFARVPTADSGADISVASQLKLNFTKIGPGVFFALFGAAVLVQALANPLRLERQAAAVPPVAPAASAASSALAAKGGERLMITGATSTAVVTVTTPFDEAALARHLRFANGLPELLKPGLPMDRRVLFENSQRELKLALMRASWQSGWGDRAAFEAWVFDHRAPAPVPAVRALWDAQ